jgi:hypothetical protein
MPKNTAGTDARLIKMRFIRTIADHAKLAKGFKMSQLPNVVNSFVIENACTLMTKEGTHAAQTTQCNPKQNPSS